MVRQVKHACMRAAGMDNTADNTAGVYNVYWLGCVWHSTPTTTCRAEQLVPRRSDDGVSLCPLRKIQTRNSVCLDVVIAQDSSSHSFC